MSDFLFTILMMFLVFMFLRSLILNAADKYIPKERLVKDSEVRESIKQEIIALGLIEPARVFERLTTTPLNTTELKKGNHFLGRFGFEMFEPVDVKRVEALCVKIEKWLDEVDKEKQ